MRKIFLFCLLFSACDCLYAQDHNLIDSLKKVLPTLKEDSNKANTINLLARNLFFAGDVPEAERLANQALALSTEIKFKKGQGNALHTLGRVYDIQGKKEAALQSFSKSLELMQEIKNAQGISRAKYGIALYYFSVSNYPEALKHYYDIVQLNGDSQVMGAAFREIAMIYRALDNDSAALENLIKASKLFEEMHDYMDLALSILDIGELNNRKGEYDEALKKYSSAFSICKEKKFFTTLTECYFKFGDYYFQQGENAEEKGDKNGADHNYRMALDNYNLSIDGAKRYNENNRLSSEGEGIAWLYINLGNTQLKLHNTKEAKSCFEKALSAAKASSSQDALQSYYYNIVSLDTLAGNFKKAFEDYKLYRTYHDSVQMQFNTRKIVQVQMQFDFDEKEAIRKAEQEKKDIVQRNIRNSILAGLAGVLIFSVVVFRQRNKISKEKKRSESLLLNILPAETAEELKKTGTSAARDFDEVTVLFTDFKNFTLLSEQLSAQELVSEINYCYSAFDNIISKYGVEKIKTIGDSYMCAGGLPVANKTNAVDTVSAAMEIRDFVLNEQQKREAQGKPYFEVRIGCNTGPVVAGIVGIKKFAYDIWGDTVNIASRMESSGQPGKVNISGTTYELVKDKFACTYRGKVEAKNKGMVDMYFVEPL